MKATPKHKADPLYYFWRDLKAQSYEWETDWNALHRNKYFRLTRLTRARLDAAREPKDMSLPGLRLHPMTGRLDGFWAVDVSGNWRLIFRFDGHDVYDVDYLDYH